MSPSRWPRSPFRDMCSSTSFGSSRNCGHRRSRQQRNYLDLSRVPRKTMGDTRLDERKFGMLKRASASQPAPKHIYKPQSRLNGILFLSKSRDGRSLSNDRAVIWRMSDQRTAVQFDALFKAKDDCRGG